MRKYKRISFRTPVFNSIKKDVDELVSEEINERIQVWLEGFEVAPEYRLINADTFMDPRTSTAIGIQSAYTIIHIEYTDNSL